MIRQTFMAAALVVASAPAAFAGTGTAEFFATIRDSGSIARGSGVTASGKVSTGVYAVTFPRPINTCIHIATPISAAAHKAEVRVTNANLNRVIVYTFFGASTAQDVGFNLLVKCQD